METTVSLKCKKCQQLLRLSVDTEQVGTCLTEKCPNCGVTAKLLLTPDVAKMIEEAIRKKAKQKAEAKVAKDSGADSTYVPLKDGNKERVLILTIHPSEETPRQFFEIVQEYSTLGKKNTKGPIYQPVIEINTLDKYMSKKHCLIRKLDNRQYCIEDYNSKNGTYLNGKKLAPGEVLYLVKGDVIRIGHTELVVSFKDV